MSLHFPSNYPAPTPTEASSSPPTFTTSQQIIFDNFIKSHEIILIQKGDAHLPYCQYSKKMAMRLVSEGIRYYAFNVWEARELEEAGQTNASHFIAHLKQQANCHTFPQLWVHGRFITNLDALQEFDSDTWELGQYLMDTLGDIWVEPPPELYEINSDQLLIRVRDPHTGEIISCESLEEAKEHAREMQYTKLNLIKNPGPGYQNILEDDSGFPTSGVVPLFGETEITYGHSDEESGSRVNHVRRQRQEKQSSRWLVVLPAIIGVALFVWHEWRIAKNAKT